MKNRFVRDAGIILFSSITTLAVNMGQTKIISDYYSLEDYGLYSQFMLIATLLLSFARLGLPNAPNFFIPTIKDAAEKRRFISQLYGLLTIAGIVTSVVVAVCFTSIVTYYDNPRLVGVKYALIFLPWIQVLESVFSTVMVTQGKAKISALFSVIKAVSFCAVSVGIVGFKEDIVTFIYARLILEALLTLGSIIISFCTVRGISLKPDGKMIKKILVYALPLGVASVVGTLTLETDKLFVTYFFPGAENLAVYTNMAKELPLTTLASSFTAVLIPQMVKKINQGDSKAAFKLWGGVVEFSTILIALFVAGFIVFNKEVITLLYDEKYLSGAGTFVVYQLVLLLRVTQFSMALNAKGKSMMIFACSAGTLVLNCILNYLFCKLFGQIGFACATFVSILLINIVQLVLGAHVCSVKLRDMWPWKRIGGILLVNAVFGVVFYFIRDILNIADKNVYFAVILGGVWALLYLLLFGKYMYKLLKNMKTENS